MKCRAIVTFTTAHGEIPAGSILNIPDALLSKLAGKVEALSEPVPVKMIHMPSVHPQQLTTCQARKVGGRICGASLREGINGFLSCSDSACQVPATPNGLIRRGGAK